MSRPIKNKPSDTEKEQMDQLFNDLVEAGLSHDVSRTQVGSIYNFPRWDGQPAAKHRPTKGTHKKLLNKSFDVLVIYDWLKSMGLTSNKCYKFVSIVFDFTKSDLDTKSQQLAEFGYAIDWSEYRPDDTHASSIFTKYKSRIRIKLNYPATALSDELRNYPQHALTILENAIR